MKAKTLHIALFERISDSRPIKFRRRQLSVDTESVTIGSLDQADVKLRQYSDPFLFEIKFHDDAWWVVNPLHSSQLTLNGRAVELEARLSPNDELLIQGHRMKTSLRDEQIVAVPRFDFVPESDDGLWCYLLEDSDFDEVLINGCSSIFVDHKGSLFRAPWAFSNNEYLEKRIFEATQKTSGWISWRRNRHLRINAALPPISQTPHIAIRRANKSGFSFEQLEKANFGTPEQMKFLKEMVLERKNIIISGGTSTGKTSLLRSLIEIADPRDRILIAEEEAEVQWTHPHAIALESGRGQLRETVVECLRMRPTRLIVSEVRGPETFDMLQAMNTGHSGSMTTVHANSAREALSRIESLALCSEVPLTLPSIRRQMTQAIHIIVQLTRNKIGERKIDHIVSIAGMEGDIILLSDPIGSELLGLKQEER